MPYSGQFLRFIKIRFEGGDRGLNKGNLGRKGPILSHQVLQTTDLQITRVSYTTKCPVM